MTPERPQCDISVLLLHHAPRSSRMADSGSGGQPTDPTGPVHGGADRLLLEVGQPLIGRPAATPSRVRRPTGQGNAAEAATKPKPTTYPPPRTTRPTWEPSRGGCVPLICHLSHPWEPREPGGPPLEREIIFFVLNTLDDVPTNPQTRAHSRSEVPTRPQASSAPINAPPQWRK